VAALRIGRSNRLRVVDAILSGTHESGTSHLELLRAFVDDETLSRVNRGLDPFPEPEDCVDEHERFLHNRNASVAMLRWLFAFGSECRSRSLQNQRSP
jgi:hypothetical protein